MKKEYYDAWRFQQALYLRDTNPYEAKVKLEEYIQDYPEDYTARGYYASVLITLQKFDEAEKVLNDTEYLIKQNSHFAKHFEKIKLTEGNILFVKLRLLAYQEKYDEFFGFLTTCKQKLKNHDFSEMDFYCKKQLGRINKDKRNKNSYLFRQIIEYREEDFLEHIQKHLADPNSALDNPNKNIFVPGFPIDEVLKEVRKNMDSSRRICPGFKEDVYIFKYDNCGRVDNRLVDYIEVICFHNTTNIITILPIDYGENIPHVDLNYMVRPIETKEVKRPSAVDKFNKRCKR